ncbi:MAG: VanZ family protein [Bergeyella zoohelcum]|nr:VanZ family protein [Bergeyella zoohelcum]
MPIYWAFLTYILLRSSTNQASFQMFNILGLDKIIHFGAFVFLGISLKFFFKKIKFPLFVILIISYACLTEYLQYVMDLGRTAEFLDIIADILGGSLGSYLYKKYLM